MIAKDNRNIMITLSKDDLKKLEVFTKHKSKEVGLKLTKSQVISMLLNNAISEPVKEPVKEEPVKAKMVVEQRPDMSRPKDTSDMSLLQQMIYYLNYECRVSYVRIGSMLNPTVSERSIKDYMYGKIKNPSDDKIAQLRQICRQYGKKF